MLLLICVLSNVNRVYISRRMLNSLPNDKILDMTKLKAFADDKINVAQIMISVFDWVEDIVGQGENASNQHFLLFPQCFQKGLLSWGHYKSGLCGKESIYHVMPLSTFHSKLTSHFFIYLYILSFLCGGLLR